MEKIPISAQLLRQGLNSRELRRKIINYNDYLLISKDKKDKKEKKIKDDFKKMRPRFAARGGRTKLTELQELERRGFF
jgi:CRISPR/Cas system CSM-associated protein Csm2 small subunit